MKWWTEYRARVAYARKHGPPRYPLYAWALLAAALFLVGWASELLRIYLPMWGHLLILAGIGAAMFYQKVWRK